MELTMPVVDSQIPIQNKQHRFKDPGCRKGPWDAAESMTDLRAAVRSALYTRTMSCGLIRSK